jgi:polyisoprenoid-binding protein YceI
MAEAPTSAFDGALLARGSAATGDWRLDPEQSQLAFATKHAWGLITIRGRFATLDGRANVAADGTITASLSIDAASVDTRQKRRDKHLRSADFFDAERHPTIEVNAHDVRLGSEDAASVQADVVVLGIARIMTFDVEIALSEGGRTAAVDTVVMADHRSFGMRWNPLRAVAPTTEVTAHLVFFRPDETVRR